MQEYQYDKNELINQLTMHMAINIVIYICKLITIVTVLIDRTPYDNLRNLVDDICTNLHFPLTITRILILFNIEC